MVHMSHGCPKSVERELGCCRTDTLLLVSEEDSILKNKISSYVEKYMVLGKNQRNIHRGKSWFSNLILLKLGVSEVVNKSSQTIHMCLDSLKAFRNLWFNNGYKIGNQV